MGLVATKVSSLINGNARILILGLDASGKTTILYRLKLNEVVETTPTIGLNVEVVNPCKNVSLTMWDIGYKQQLTPLVQDYYGDADGVVFVLDASDASDRIEEARKHIMQTMKAKQLNKGVPLIIFANKQDQPNARKKEELTETLHLIQILNHPWHVQEMSAITGNGLIEGVEALNSMVKKYQIKKLRTRSSSK